MSRAIKTYLASLLLRCGIVFLLLYCCFRTPDWIKAQLYHYTWHPNVINVIWFLLALTMLRRFVPEKHANSFGHQKQFSSRFQPTAAFLNGELDVNAIARELRTCNHGVLAVAVVWCVGNGLIFWLYTAGYFDERLLLLLSAAYSVGDIVCILFYCPFQKIWMHNSCCTTCRIYNWDFMMLCTPLLAIRSFYTWSLCALAATLFLRWEWVAHRHPERFLSVTNQNLHCQHCVSRLCQFKRKK